MTYENKCLLSSKCKKAGTPQCGELCFPYIKLHGEKGNGGALGLAGIPKLFANKLMKDLPIEESNPRAFRKLNLYISDLVAQVNEGVGLYLHGTPSETNRKGCGNGKTTAAAIIINEYIAARVIQDVKKEARLDDVPALFMNVSKFQNTFNSMFRGTLALKDTAAINYYKLKDLMSKVPLLVMDDIGVRDATEAFKSEFYEVIDDRNNEMLATIFTSNVPIDDLVTILDDRIASRIEGATIPVSFGGVDHRKRGI